MKIYFDDPMVDAPAYVDDLAPMPAPAPARQRRGLRNWQKFLLVYSPIIAGIALLLGEVVLRTGGNVAGAQYISTLVSAIGTMATLVVFTLAYRAGRL